VPNVSRHRSTENQTSGPSVLGIWRMGHTVHQNKQVALSLAQPADAVGSPRWDYAVKRALANQVEGQRQIGQFVACATSIVHPNVVPVMDASTTGTTPYLVMPRIEGRTMGEYLANVSTPLPVALWLVRQLAQALDATHTAGWVHGDLKPDNAIVGVRGHVTLIDFGFASRVHSVPNHVYRGTPDYSSPETLTGQTAMMPAMDIFSLGRLLWQWLAQSEPASETLMEPVAEMIEKMVSQDPMERPEASEVAKQLLRLEIETLGCHLVPSVTRRAA
jgi:serine/threonine protein kinase